VSGFKGNPFAKHAPLAIEQDHFDRWLALFYDTIDTHFEGPVADDSKKRAGIMAEMFLYRLKTMTNPNRVVM
jgi:hemoglobin